MGMQEDIKELKKIVTEQSEETKNNKKKKERKFKIPGTKRVRPHQTKKNFVTIIKINDNGSIDFDKQMIDEQTIVIDGIPRLASANYVMHYKKNPIIIQPSWSVEPFSPVEKLEKSLNDGSNTTGYKILLAKMKSDMQGAKKQMGGMIKWILGLGLAAIIGYAILTGGGT